jgi:hypothetical protein
MLLAFASHWIVPFSGFGSLQLPVARLWFIVPCGLLGGAARIIDEAVDRGFPVNGQARHCAMPDADRSHPTVTKLR